MTQNNKLIEQLRAVTESIMDLRIKQQGGAIITEQHLHSIEMDIFKAMDAATEIASLHPLTKIREEVERLRDEAQVEKYKSETTLAKVLRDGKISAFNQVLSLLTQENDGNSFEEAVEEYVLDIMKNNYTRFLSYALSLIGKEIFKTNSDEFTFSQEADLAPNQRYKIEMKGTIQPLPSPPKSK